MVADARYTKDIRSGYLILNADMDSLRSYQLRMILNNDIKGLLKMELRMINNSSYYYYNITSKQTLQEMLEGRLLNHSEIVLIMKSITKVVENIEEYFLSEHDLVLELDSIYMESSESEVSLCYFIGFQEDLMVQLVHLIERLMNNINHKDEKAVLFIYKLYKISRETGCIFRHIADAVKNESINPQQKEDFIGNPYADNYSQEPSLIFNHEHSYQDIFQSRTNVHSIGDNNTGSGIKNAIPMMKERVENEEEILIYSKQIVAAGIFSLIASIIISFIALQSKMLYNTFQTHLDMKKVIIYLIIVILIEGYILLKLFHRQNRIPKVVKKIDYVDNNELYGLCETEDISKNPNRESRAESANLNTEILYHTKDDMGSLKESDTDHTEILASLPPQIRCLLRASEQDNNEKYQDIYICEYPFFVGKLKTNSSHILKHRTISRYHARIDYESNLMYITDLNSTNGTYLNGIKLTPEEKVLLNEGDRVMFADITFEFTFL